MLPAIVETDKYCRRVQFLQAWVPRVVVGWVPWAPTLSRLTLAAQAPAPEVSLDTAWPQGAWRVHSHTVSTDRLPGPSSQVHGDPLIRQDVQELRDRLAGAGRGAGLMTAGTCEVWTSPPAELTRSCPRIPCSPHDSRGRLLEGFVPNSAHLPTPTPHWPQFNTISRGKVSNRPHIDSHIFPKHLSFYLAGPGPPMIHLIV